MSLTGIAKLSSGSGRSAMIKSQTTQSQSVTSIAFHRSAWLALAGDKIKR